MGYRYTQTVIGTCGHVCDEWPQVTGIGGSNPQVICDECTRKEYGIDPREQVAVWVRVEEVEKKPAKPPAKKRAPKKPAALKQADFWGSFLDGA